MLNSYTHYLRSSYIARKPQLIDYSSWYSIYLRPIVSQNSKLIIWSILVSTEIVKWLTFLCSALNILWIVLIRWLKLEMVIYTHESVLCLKQYIEIYLKMCMSYCFCHYIWYKTRGFQRVCWYMLMCIIYSIMKRADPELTSFVALRLIWISV